ncbi:MAG: hypothetical protein HY039_01065 [Nitrospirae bacterium]|nr:hypothetical protein [Nitrospirota bacterium]
MFEEILAKLGKSLRDHRVPYMIIGGQAVLIYGEPRLTRDIDVTLGLEPSRAHEVLSLVRELSLRPLPENPSAFVQETMVLPTLDDITGIRVDFIFSFTPYEREAIGRGRIVKIGGQEVCFASPEDLVIHKVFAGRPRDLEDVRSILLKNRNIDIGHIRACLKDFGSASDGRNFLNTFETILKEVL